MYIQKIIEKYNPEAAFNYGSFLYKNKKPSDYDFIIVTDKDYFQESFELEGVKFEVTNYKKEQFLGEENEWLAIYAKEKLKQSHYDYFIFGHRHIPLNIDLGSNSRYINLGEWIHYQTFMKIDSEIPQYFTWDGQHAHSYDPPYGKGK